MTPDAPPPRRRTGADGRSDLGTSHGKTTAHRADRCATCTPRPLAFIGTPARIVAGQLLSGDKHCWEIAHEFVDVLGPTAAAMLAQAIFVRVGRLEHEATL